MSNKTPKEVMLESFEAEELAEKETMNRLEEARETIEEDKGNKNAIVHDADGKKLGNLGNQIDWAAFDDYEGLGPTKKIKGKEMFVVPGKLFTHIPAVKGVKTVYVSV